MRNNKARERRTHGLSYIPLAGLQKFMFAFMILAVLLLAFAQPIQKKGAKAEDAKSIGDMTVEIEWPGCRKYEQDGATPVCTDRVDIDIDLWVKSPDDDRPVGFSNRSGKTLNLLRDDLGTTNDTTDRNYELVSTRGLPAGEYIVNLHYFASRELDKALEIPVTVVISTKSKGVFPMKRIITRNAILRVQKEQITVARFTIREDGELDEQSVNDFYEELTQ